MTILLRSHGLLASACVATIGVFAGCRAAPPAASARSYDVALLRGGEELALAADFPPGGERTLTVAPLAQQFILDVRAEIDGHERELRFDGGWTLPASAGERHVRWRFAARAAAKALDRIDLAAARGQGIVGSLAAFLLRADDADDDRVELHAQLAPGEGFASVDGLAQSPSCAFGPIRVTTQTIGGLTLELAELEPRAEAAAAALADWSHAAASAVIDGFGRAPVDHLLVIVGPGPGGRSASRHRQAVGDASTFGAAGATIYAAVRADATAAELERDWTLTHEMIHVAFPSLPAQHHWLEEGLAIYLEPILRARQGRGSEQEVWRSMIADYPQGLPAADDPGLDHVDSWARTYYGGAIFWLEADVAIRARTRNAKSLQDALRALAAAGGNITTMWPGERVIEVGDAATGTTVLAELYAQMKDAPEPRELDSLWQRLGVRIEGRSLRLDDGAPLAEVRRALVLGGR